MRRLTPLILFILGQGGGFAQCSLTNINKLPLPDMGFARYQGYDTGLYPNFSNNRPPAHLVAGLAIANSIQPLDANGNVNTNSGKIVLLSVGMSNTTHEWASGSNDGGGTSYTFRSRANLDPSRNPQVLIVDGAQGGQDATRWTNITAATWSTVLTRLTSAGATTNQVRVVWLKQSLMDITQYGSFPEAIQELQRDIQIIAQNLKTLYPHIQIAYVSSRTRCYSTNSTATNPEPYSWEAGFATKWMIQRQIDGAADLNFDPGKGAVVAPWLSWGPYLWVDGTSPRSDGLTWLCSDVVSDFTHPSSSGVWKVGTELLAFFKTDPTATPWFLRKNIIGLPPTCTMSADVTNGVAPLTVNFAATASDPDGTIRDLQWTFDDGTFATNAHPVKVFNTAGQYTARLTVTDNDGNTVTRSIPISVAAVAITNVSVTNGQFQLRTIGATNFDTVIDRSPDLFVWTSVTTNHNPFTYRDTNAPTGHAFYRARAQP